MKHKIINQVLGQRFREEGETQETVVISHLVLKKNTFMITATLHRFRKENLTACFMFTSELTQPAKPPSYESLQNYL